MKQYCTIDGVTDVNITVDFTSKGNNKKASNGKFFLFF
jgi:hypothetical protein